MNKPSHNVGIFIILSIIFSGFQVFGSCLSEPVESYYTVKDYGSAHFRSDSLFLDEELFVELIEKVNEKMRDRAFLIEVPNDLYSENVAKLRAAQFFHYFDYPEQNASVWCRTNGSGIPLVASHTFGARSLVYYKENAEYFFLLVKDKYGFRDYEVPGGYVQPDDREIVKAFEGGCYKMANLDYRSPEEAAISEVLEETGFDLAKYGYGVGGSNTPLIIAQIYTKNTRPGLGIHSVNDCCQYLLFEVTSNNDPLKKQDHEISDVRWASYTEIINDRIDSPIDIHSTTNNIKILVQRIVAADKYRETRRQLSAINRQLQDLISIENIDIEEVKRLVQEQLDLEKLKKQLETKLKQSYENHNGKYARYFAPF